MRPALPLTLATLVTLWPLREARANPVDSFGSGRAGRRWEGRKRRT